MISCFVRHITIGIDGGLGHCLVGSLGNVPEGSPPGGLGPRGGDDRIVEKVR